MTDKKEPPSIHQFSYGPNSPNIVGSHNQVTINAPRVLTQEQGERIVRAVSRISPGEFAVTAYLSAEDGKEYGAYLASAIADGGWIIQGNCINRSVGTSADSITGVALLVHDLEDPPARAVDLSNALRTAGISAPLALDPALSSNTVVLWIGRR